MQQGNPTNNRKSDTPQKKQNNKHFILKTEYLLQIFKKLKRFFE